MSELVNQATLRLGKRNLEGAIKRGVGGLQAQVRAEHHQRIRHRANDRLRMFVLLPDEPFRSLQVVDIHQHQHRAIHLVVDGQIGADAHRIPATVPPHHFALTLPHVGNDLEDEGVQIRQIEIVPDAPEGPAHVAGLEAELFLGLQAEAADRQVAPEQHDDKFGRGLEVGEIAVEPVEFNVPTNHLLVDGREFFVGGLEFLLRRFQFLIEALQLLVGGLTFLVGRLEFLVGRVLILLDRFQVIARLGEVLFQRGDAARFSLLGDAFDRNRRRVGRFGEPSARSLS